MKPVEVIVFPKLCPHGVRMRVERKLSGAWWYDSDACSTCREKREAEQEVGEDAFLEWLGKRRLK